jgi:sulfur dioxygenase
MQPIQLFDPASSTYTYVIFDETTREAIIIDPVDEQLERDLATLREYGLKLIWTIETHAHADHITSAGLLAEHTGAKTAAPGGLRHHHGSGATGPRRPCTLAAKC